MSGFHQLVKLPAGKIGIKFIGIMKSI